MFRGIITTINVDLKKNIDAKKIHRYLSKFYKKSKFVKIKKINSLLSTNEVINTNNCLISICNSKNKNKLIIILIFVTNCSIDTKTGIWENKKEISTDTELSSLSFDENLTFDEFKNNVIIYGKKSEYPKLME